MKISEKRKKWLTKRAFRNCFLISVGVFIISTIFELTRITITAQLPFPENVLFAMLAVLVLTAWLWFMGFMSPEYMETAFAMIGFQRKRR